MLGRNFAQASIALFGILVQSQDSAVLTGAMIRELPLSGCYSPRSLERHAQFYWTDPNVRTRLGCAKRASELVGGETDVFARFNATDKRRGMLHASGAQSRSMFHVGLCHTEKNSRLCMLELQFRKAVRTCDETALPLDKYSNSYYDRAACMENLNSGSAWRNSNFLSWYRGRVTSGHHQDADPKECGQ